MIRPETLAGKEIDHFRLEAFIARGAMGMVFKATDTVLARTVALKLIQKGIEDALSDPEIACHEEALKRLIQEAKAAGRLTHPNIVTVHSYGETDEFKYICMEYVSGKTLAQILNERGKIPVEEATPILEQILLALDAADREGIVHRDIKPANIMITKDNLVKVMDFGIAKLPSLAVTLTGMILGTPYYMSPEQISGRRVDIRSDLFSVGTVAYEILTGSLPFEGESTATVLYKIIQADPVSPRDMNEFIPESLARVVSKAMAKDPSQRYKSPREMLNDLMGIPQPDAPTVVSLRSAANEKFENSEIQPATAHLLRPSGTIGQIPPVKPTGGPSPKIQDFGSATLTRQKESISKILIFAMAVIVAGAVFAGWYFKGSISPRPGPVPHQPPATIQDTASPASPPSADVKSRRPAESLLLEAGRQFTSNPETAQKLLEQALSQEPGNYDCSLALARLLSYRKNYAAATRQYQHALSLDNSGADVHYELGNIFLAQNDYDSAIQSFNASLALQPRNMDEILASLGFCHLKKGDLTRAKLSLTKSLELNPNNTTAKAFMAGLPK